MPLLSEKLAEADAILRASGVIDPRREASSLVAIALNRDKAFLIAHPEYELRRDENETVNAFVRRRSSREPFQYISGIQEFYGLEFDVTPDVLIPRPETEMVVEHAIGLLRASGHASLCDVGTGSGCIAVSILHELKHVTAIGLDVSLKALEVARLNAAKHHVEGRLSLIESDVFNALEDDERFDMIVSNPPYIPEPDMAVLQAEVRDFEPREALTAGSDGLSIIKRIALEAPSFLVARGRLVVEIGCGQSEQVAAMFDKTKWFPPELLPDLQGIPRLVSARLM